MGTFQAERDNSSVDAGNCRHGTVDLVHARSTGRAMNGERDFGRGNLLAALSMARIISASLAWAGSRITLALLVPMLTTTSPISRRYR